MNESIKNFLNEEKEQLNILPKKSNMDLKKFLEKKFDKLKKRTEKAIVAILQQNLKKINLKD